MNPPEPQSDQRDRRLGGPVALHWLWALFFASGLAALIYQVMWARRFGLVFGSTSRAAAAVLASFFLGMAIGNWLGGRRARSRRSALLLYGLAELAIAAGALLVFLWLWLYEAHYPDLYELSWFRGAAAGGLQLLLAFVAMAPPCIALGATLPLISHAAVDEDARIGRRVAGLYALNTAGATAGVLLSGFLLPVWIGTRSSILLAAVINLAVGMLALGLWRSWRGADAPRPPAEARALSQATGTRARWDPLLLVVVAASGLGTLALEVLFTRLIVTATDSSVYSFALMLATFLVALALGSAVVSAVVDRLRTPWVLIAGSCALTCVAVMLAPGLFTSAVRVVAVPGLDFKWNSILRLLVCAGLTAGPSALFAGVALPTAWRIATRSAQETGARVGTLTAINTLAAVAGSLLAGFVLIPVLGLELGFAWIAALYCAMAVVAWTRAASGGWRWLGAAGAVLCLLLPWGAETWRVTPLSLRGGEQLVSYRDGESVAVAVTRDAAGVLKLRVNNRYVLGNSDPAGVRLQRTQGQLALTLAREPRSAAFIGVATGVSVSAAAQFPSLERVLALELIPGVVEAAALFERHNRRILQDPRVEVVVADGRNHLYGRSERFDVIVGDLFVPWHAGSGYLYTLEHFRVVADRLQPGGVFVQWLQAAQLSLGELRIVVATFADAFGRVALYRVEGIAVVALVGGGGEVAPIESTLPAGVRLVCGDAPLRSWAAPAPRNTDDWPGIEFSAAASHLDGSSVRGEASLSRIGELCSRAQ